MNPKFLYHCMRTKSTLRTKQNTWRSTRAIRNEQWHSKSVFPVPSLEEQARIVAILDQFDALVNDLSSGLPAEIAARRQQYAYYRDRLLTFNEMTPSS